MFVPIFYLSLFEWREQEDRISGVTATSHERCGSEGAVNLVACLVAGRIVGLFAARWEGLA